MNAKAIAWCAAAFLGMVSEAQAATASSGVLRFTGSVVAPLCRASTGQAVLWMDDCPPQARANAVDIQRVDRQTGDAQVVRVDDRRGTNQQYRLVDSHGQALTQGSYVITLTLP
ncbi:hypothetical protein ACNFBR_16800 [Pseudomonas sp. NY11955]|uniref:hypothetical protein n=1 Tax=Pseudomonas sp. NY11955 TaxID=3400363 RepID=UPI003A8614EE